ncbi:MAG: hypothetical protein MSC31_18810 [Solirubrobacteraceae bacterium MAG38_C4-C5]|nr:hypothetical protein [Candidatus Siliceabacter maunaloa]
MAIAGRIDDARPRAPSDSMLDVDVDGALVRLRARYDPRLVERLKTLPGRRYVPEDKAWVLPARRQALGALARLLLELGDQATLTDRAHRRLRRDGPGRLQLRDGEFEVHAASRPERQRRIRALPERRYLAERSCWRLPVTRAGALALEALIDDGELVATPSATARLEQAASAHSSSAPRSASGHGGERATPTPDWRHVTRGPIFAANPHRREWLDGVGWCVRVRVDPAHCGLRR